MQKLINYLIKYVYMTRISYIFLQGRGESGSVLRNIF